MLGESSSGEAVAVGGGGGGGGAVVGGGGGGGGGSTSGDEERRMEEGERGSFGGNRWPRQETLALLRIRSDMDVAFRDASVKSPLWEQVSRKLAELGYHRNAKKCKEKFENVYKYHKRTKEGRSGKSEGKTYRFFDQLEALDHLHQPPTTPSPNPPQPPLAPPPLSSIVPTTTVAVPMSQVVNNTTHSCVPHVTVPSTTTGATTVQSLTMNQGIVVTTTPSISLPNIPSYPPTNPTIFPTPPPLPPQATTINPTANNATVPISFPNIPNDLLSNSSSSTSSDDGMLEDRHKRKRKRKWEDFFHRLMKGVVKKQEEQQRTFLEAIEKREHELMAREEAWRVQEMQRINREREILAQERSVAAVKDAAVMAFLQKIAEQQNGGQALNTINIPTQPQPQPVAQPIAPQTLVPDIVPTLVQPQVQSQQPQLQLVVQPGPPIQPVVVPPVPPQQHQLVTTMEPVRADNNGENMMGASSSRWPKVEIEALIKLRTELDAKYQENVPKGPLWEEISSSMRKLGYNRNAKRCKEKWENINKYFKKVKESNKNRPQDSKTCPYFHQLDALYREKKKMVQPESIVAPLMVQPEQQWPPQQHREEEEEGDDDDFDEEEKDNGEEEEDEENGSGGKYEVVANKGPSAASVGGASGE
ncbi:unnamed protein product [Lupinus luteus]|uniref:Myb-like domain-containing protein n=1 Tax=Lupinus luteus TaxID=3873 RepID=A0AAV1X4B0_LUPLU